MKIKSVEMTNVKCYSHSKFDFENGINFISGINGAGKTSIIESIGFALFNYKVGGKIRFNSYFIKRGEKKAIVKLVFQDKNNKDYIVERKVTTSSNNSWIIKDINTEEEIVSGEEDVSNWIKDNLGFYRDDNIADIFENIISVPQGMFTSAFLDTAQNRKNKFDPIFKLEIYRKVFGNTVTLQSGLKNKKVQKEIEQGKLQTTKEILEKDKLEYKSLKKEIDAMKKDKKEKENQYKNIEKSYNEKKSVKDEIDKTARKIEIDKVKEENANKQLAKLKKELENADKVQEQEKELEKQLVELEQLKLEVKNLQESENKINESKEKINKAEMAMQGILKDIQRNQKIVDEESKLKENKNKLDKIIENKEQIDNEKIKIDNELNKLSANFEQIKESKKIAKAGICPFLKTECINVKGKTVEEYETEMKEIENKIIEIKTIKKEIEMKEKNIIKAEAELKSWKDKIQELEEAKKELIENKEKIRINEEIKQEAEKEIYKILKNNKIEKITEFKVLLKDRQNKFNTQNTQYNILKTKLENIKKQQEKVKADLLNYEKELSQLIEDLKINEDKIKKLYNQYDENEFKKIEEEKNNLSVQLTEIKTKLSTNNERLEKLKDSVEKLKQINVELDETNKKIKVYEKAIDYVNKIRNIIKQAPEDISEILIQKVSRKATEIYSQIANDNTKLEWRESYEVVLIDSIDGKEVVKEFRQLSGGEQMSAALAIRISMLDILTDLKIGILDEPTVNMDAGRRQRLAEIIEHIGGAFIQLFVVSHDDTFNSITENMIQL